MVRKKIVRRVPRRMSEEEICLRELMVSAKPSLVEGSKQRAEIQRVVAEDLY